MVLLGRLYCPLVLQRSIVCMACLKQKRYSTGFARSIVVQVLRAAFGVMLRAVSRHIQFWVLTG